LSLLQLWMLKNLAPISRIAPFLGFQVEFFQSKFFLAKNQKLTTSKQH
jgi:hypothetical protein